MNSHAELLNTVRAAESEDSAVVVQIIGLVNGGKTPLDGQWLVDYDPRHSGEGFLSVYIETTPDRSQARRFDDFRSACATLSQAANRPRPDGMPDRPLTAFNLCIERASLCH